ncbi:hypothetical protein BS47DRAFT_1400320 [Hydnum rufescens UP504]|uniref:Uncharacterized protein n=1 Tax=Hydnum rufescens UP504 TaxID=1448309 RepID=A0A9P6AGP8_9AGAM|nr:hypothetical protein BS47DRAFT_1400320 [Hydnum rufescens UP504]
MEFTNNIQYKHHLRALHQESTDVPTLGVIARQPDGFHCPECSYIHTNVENFRRHVHISALIKGARASKQRLHSPEREAIIADTDPIIPDVPEVVSNQESEYVPEVMASEPALHLSHALIHPPALVALQLGIDPVHHLIICGGHGYAVPWKDLASHFQRNTEHKGQHLPANIDEILEAHDAAKEILHPTGLVAPIQSIPCHPGFHCLKCNHANIQHSSMLKHLSLEHPGSVAKDCIKACTVQIVFGRKRVGQVWAVEPNYSTFPAHNHQSVQFLEHLKAKELELEVLDVIQTPEDPCQTSIFLRRFQWLTATDGRPFKKLHGLTAKPVKKEQEFLDLEERVEGYFTRLRPLVMEMQPLVLKWINTPDE